VLPGGVGGMGDFPVIPTSSSKIVSTPVESDARNRRLKPFQIMKIIRDIFMI